MPSRPIMPFLVFLALIAARPAVAQPPDSPPRVSVSAEWSHDSYLPGSQGALAVILEMEPTWHVYPGKGSPDEPESYIPTTVDLIWPTGWTQGAIQWPEAHDVLFGPEGAQEQIRVYEGRAIVYVPFAIDANATPGPASVTITVGFQACDDSVCEMPRSIPIDLNSRVVADANSIKANPNALLKAAFSDILSKPVAPLDGTEPPPSPDPVVSAPVETAPPGRTFFGIPLPEQGGVGNLMLLAAISALGGFILNLTPCVLPVIPIKIMTIMQHADHPGRSLVLGLWMALGVIAFWTGIGLPVAFVSGITDPSRLFGIWWVTLGIGVLIALMGVGIMGLFSIQLPQSVYAINPKADTAWGSFVFGVMTAVLGLPCFGFVAGALLAGVATMPPSSVMTIFASLGVGMASPYIVLSANPKLLDRLPRTGPASELVKQVMGLLLLAAAAYFVGAGLIGLVNERPYLSHQLHWWAVAMFGAMSGFWLIVRTFQISSKTGPRAAFTLIGLILGGIAVLYALDSTAKARDDWNVRQAALAASGGAGYIHGAWNEWTPATFEKARSDGHVVVLDFTAEWCLNCKVIKAAVLNKEPVKGELGRDDVVKFTVDLTSTKAPGWQFLNDLGQTGIPLLVIYTPGDDQPWQSNAYTSQQVLDALSNARASRSEAAAPRALREYSAGAFEQALDSEATVVLCFSAEWSLNTKLLTHVLFKDNAVRSELSKPGTIGFEVDVTSTSAEGWELVARFGIPGIPCVAVFGTDRAEPWIANSASADKLITAIADARKTR